MKATQKPTNAGKADASAKPAQSNNRRGGFTGNEAGTCPEPLFCLFASELSSLSRCAVLAPVLSVWRGKRPAKMTPWARGRFCGPAQNRRASVGAVFYMSGEMQRLTVVVQQPSVTVKLAATGTVTRVLRRGRGAAAVAATAPVLGVVSRYILSLRHGTLPLFEGFVASCGIRWLTASRARLSPPP